MRTITSLIVLLMAIVSTGVTAQVVTGSFTHGGVVRTYRLYIPSIYSPSTPVPLVFNLHGYTSNNIQQEAYGDFRSIADTANFIIAHPNGTLDGLGNRFWNTFGGSTVNDLGFLTALIDTIGASYNIDPDRVYSTGMSNGGFMSYDLACFRSERFAAVASVTGTMIAPRLTTCAPGHPVPVMHIHGTADGTVPYNGGNGFVPVETLVNYWVNFNNCDPLPTVIQVPNTSTTDGSTVEHQIYSNGDAGSIVEFFKVTGGGHTWPGSAIPVGVTNQDINASVEIWRFFSQYRLGDLLTNVSTARPTPLFSVGPNPSMDLFHLWFTDAAPRTITVTNALGQVVLYEQCTADGTVVRLNAPGVYHITVEQGADRWSERLLKL